MRFKISPDALDRFAGHLRLAGNGSAAFLATPGVVSTCSPNQQEMLSIATKYRSKILVMPNISRIKTISKLIRAMGARCIRA